MQIETVKQLKSGYLVNGSMSVPNDTKNSDFQKIQKWIAEGGVVEAFDFSADAMVEKIAQIKGAAATLILATYPTHKQLNILMSEDGQAIETMNIFISGIREKSNDLEASLNGLSVEQIKDYPIQFTL